MRKTTITFAAVCVTMTGFSQSPLGRMDSTHLPEFRSHPLEEYTFDVSSRPEVWTTLSPGMHVGFGSTDQPYFRKEVPMNAGIHYKEFTGWKGDRLNTQVLVWSADTLKQVRFKASDLINKNGDRISAENIRHNLVRFVLSDYPYGAKDIVCSTSPYKDGYLMPDRFEHVDRFDLPGNTTRPVWVAIEVPQNAAAGIYKGKIEVSCEKHIQQLEVAVEVQNNSLPVPADWKYRLDLWQNPWAVARYGNVEPWSETHKMMLKQHLKMYADAGGKYITTYAVHSPWQDQSFFIEEAMIEWVKTRNGTWKFDYDIFDEYVELAMECGIRDAITLYTPLPGRERFRYLSEETGNYVYEQWEAGSDTYEKNLNIFLTDLRKHLLEKGWMKITYLGINENPMEQTLTAIRLVREHSPEWRITYAGVWHPELDSLLDDYSYVIHHEPNPDQLKKRAAAGRTSTIYVFCGPPKPNTFVFSPPVEGRWISWYAAAMGHDGFLRWAYDAWPGNPRFDARHVYWAAGDCFLVYPGGNSSIRFEKLREGIVDYEKIRIIRERASESKDKNLKELLAQFEQHMKVFTVEKEFNTEKITRDVEKGRHLLEQLSDRLPGW